MRLVVASEQRKIGGENLDFLDEIMAQILEKGDPIPKRKLTFHIAVADEGRTLNILGFVRRTCKNWRRIGKLTFDNAAASYNPATRIQLLRISIRSDIVPGAIFPAM